MRASTQQPPSQQQRPLAAAAGRAPRRPRAPTLQARAAAAAAPAAAAVTTAAGPGRTGLPAGLTSVEFFAPPLYADPAGQGADRNAPFLTTDGGKLPVEPLNLDHALYLYGEYTSKYVSVRVSDEHVKLRSWGHAVDTLRAAQAGGDSYWCSLLERVQHPAWWPAEGHVPNYDQVIFGRGNASIGLHFDKDNACAGGSRVPVATYLSICAGRKLVLLLPPGQKLLPPGGDSAALLSPSPGLLAAVRAAGGHFFLLEDLTEGAAAKDAPRPAGARPAAGGRPFSATALYMPAGWWHWVVGLSDWHVVFGGSHYWPEEVAP